MSDVEQILQKHCKITFSMISLAGLQNKSGEFNMVHMCFFLFLCGHCAAVSGYSMILGLPDDIEKFVYNFAPFVCTILVSFKLINYMKYRQEFSLLIEEVKGKFWLDNFNGPQHEKGVLLQFSRYMHICSLLATSFIIPSSMFWFAIPLGQMYITRSDEAYTRILPFNTWLPFNLDVYAEPLYEIMFILQAISLLSVAVGLVALTSLYFFLVWNTCAQFKLVQIRLKNFNKTTSGSISKIDDQVHKLHSSIKLHDEILKFCSRIESVQSIPLLMECLVGTLFLCMSAVIITMYPGTLYIYLHHGVCIIASLSEIFLHCLPATVMTTEGLAIANAAYDSDWYNAPMHIQKELKFVIARSQKPVYLTVGKLTPMSVETFEAITRTAASYFAVINSMRE